MKDKLLGVGIIGTLVAALCCFTPILAWTLSTIGLSGAIGYVYRDDVLLPLMVAFLAITGYALWRRKRMG
ncbi:MAG: mercury resistance system transport protein MerF [Geminicoccales bacterium]